MGSWSPETDACSLTVPLLHYCLFHCLLLQLEIIKCIVKGKIFVGPNFSLANHGEMYKSLVHMLKKAICERGHNIIMWTVIVKKIYEGEIKTDNN